MSWLGERQRHAMSAKGILTKDYCYNAHGKKELGIYLPAYTADRVKHINKITDGKEWIAELSIINGYIIIDDIQASDKIDYSQLRWNIGDDMRDIGYIHLHPQGIIPDFSSTDFVLAINIHKLRKNKKKYPYTIMGVVYPKNNKTVIRLYGINPKSGRIKDFENLKVTESHLGFVLDDMISTKELIKMKEVII